MIEHCLLFIVTTALVLVLNSRVSWHYRYTRTISPKRKESAVDDKVIQSTRAASNRPRKSTADRIADRQGELLVSALVNLGSSRREALAASRAAMAGCPTKDFDSLLRYALQQHAT